MRRPKRKKKITLRECSECHKQFDVDQLKILWKEYRLVCEGCYLRISGEIQQKGP